MTSTIMMKLAEALIRPWGIEERSDLPMAVQFGNKVTRRSQDGDHFAVRLRSRILSWRMIDDRWNGDHTIEGMRQNSGGRDGLTFVGPAR